MSLYENKNYNVTIGEVSLTDGTKQNIYQVVNKETGVIEEQIPQMVVAYAAADELNQALIEFEGSKEVASVSSINGVNDTMQ
jgi:hypothetical protein